MLLRRVKNPSALCNYDTSGMGTGNDVNKDKVDKDSAAGDDQFEAQQHLDCLDEDGQRRVRYLTREFFRSKLLQHFEKLHQQNKLKWPKSLNK